MKKKRVLFLIYSAHPQSGGGHFHSLMTLTKGLSSLIDFKILNTGLVHSETLVSNVKSDYIKVTKANFFFSIKPVIRYIKHFDPDVIHAFDSSSLTIARTFQMFKKTPIVYSKCGGINGGKFIQDSDAYICFSQENATHFQKNKNNNQSIHLLPNRASTTIADKDRITSLKNQYDLNTNKIILRISRFHELHERSILQAINLFKLVYNENPDYRLVIIGIKQSKSTYENVIKESQGYPILVITDPIYTKNASELLEMADIVVATGRGVMEAASLGKKIFCPVSTGTLPAPLNPENFPSMLRFNFSQRTKDIIPSEQSISQHINLDYLNNKIFISEMYNKHFNIQTVIPTYLEIYEKVKHNRISILNYIEDILRFLKPTFLSKRFYSKEINK